MNNERNARVITIDGPSGAGKGTLSQLLANQLGFHLLDSGAIYRLAALATLEQGVNPLGEAAVARLASGLNIRFDTGSDKVRAFLGDKDVTDAIRTEEVSKAASMVAALPEVRQALLQRQRDFRQPPGLVADGRDMGTTVFPDAEVKIFLTASPEARAERRYKQLLDKGETVDKEQLVNDIRDRDERDQTRSTSPLLPAEDAYVLDSTEMSIDQVLAAMVAHFKTRTET